MASKFANLTPRERRSAQAYLNNFNSSIRKWDRQASTLPQNGGVSLAPYLGYTDQALAEFTSISQVVASIQAKRAEIDEKVQQQRQAAAMGRGGHGRGMNYGQYVWVVTAYNHGQGARYQGYTAEELEPNVEMTDIEEWL